MSSQRMSHSGARSINSMSCAVAMSRRSQFREGFLCLFIGLGLPTRAGPLPSV